MRSSSDAGWEELYGVEEGGNVRSAVEHQLCQSEECDETSAAGDIAYASPDSIERGGHETGVELLVATTNQVREEDANINTRERSLDIELVED